MSRFIAIANQKGGVGKTTSTVNLAASLARFGQRVLVLDMDPQGNASSGLGVAANAMHRGAYEVLTGVMSVEEAITAQASPGVDLLPSGQRLIGAEVELVSALARERILEKSIQPIRDQYDILLADCPPSLGLLTVNTLTAADTVLIPMQCEYYALEGLTQLLNTIKLIQQALNPRLEIEGILLTMFDARLNLSHEVAEETRKFFPGRVYETVIPRNVRLSEAPSFGKPVLEYDPECAGAQFYLKLAREVLRLPEDAEPIALTQEESETRTDAAEPAHLEAATGDVAVEATVHEVAVPPADEIQAEALHESETVDVGLDRDALEVAEIAARLIQPDPVPTESEVESPALETAQTENLESPAVVEHPVTEPVSAAVEHDQVSKQPIVLSSDDLADDVLTLPEESIVLSEEDAVPLVPDETQSETRYTAETREPESETHEPNTQYDDLQPMNTQDAHPQEELVSHD